MQKNRIKTKKIILLKIFIKNNKGEGENMADDISNKTIVVLVVLTVIISVLGALVVTNGIGKMDAGAQKPAVTTSSSQGKVSLTILPEPETTTANGMVTFTVLPNA
ncbi:MAG: hypothetical protein KKF46_04820 [Nanoarchaeota archaeon]|nr:hypothetical protein [Nanoarchaeota archaeon]